MDGERGCCQRHLFYKDSMFFLCSKKHNILFVVQPGDEYDALIYIYDFMH